MEKEFKAECHNICYQCIVAIDQLGEIAHPPALITFSQSE